MNQVPEPNVQLSPRSSRVQTISWAAGLLLLAVAVYWPTLTSQFVFDDADYVMRNAELRSVYGLTNIWRSLGAFDQYCPLTFSLLWIEFQFWGLSPFGYHLV